MSLQKVKCANRDCNNTFCVNAYHKDGTEKCRHCGGKDRRFWLTKLITRVYRRLRPKQANDTPPMKSTDTTENEYEMYRAVVEYADSDTMRRVRIESDWVSHRWKAEEIVESLGPFGDEWGSPIDGYVEGRDKIDTPQ